MIDISRLNKSYPYLSLSRELGLDYADVLIVSDLYTPTPRVPANALTEAALFRVGTNGRRDICQVACAVVTGETGHGERS